MVGTSISIVQLVCFWVFLSLWSFAFTCEESVSHISFLLLSYWSGDCVCISRTITALLTPGQWVDRCHAACTAYQRCESFLLFCKEDSMYTTPRESQSLPSPPLPLPPSSLPLSLTYTWKAVLWHENLISCLLYVVLKLTGTWSTSLLSLCVIFLAKVFLTSTPELF